MLNIPERMYVPARRSLSSERWLTVLGLIVAVAVLAAGVRVILKAREDAWAQASRDAENLRLVLSRDISRNISILDLSLRGAIETLAVPGIEQVDIAVRRHALFDASASAEDLGAMLIIDADGRITEDSTSLAPHTANLGDRDYVRVHRERPDSGLYISRPYRSRIANGDPRIAISRRLPAPDGHFAGIADAALRIAYFLRLFSQLDVGPHGTIALIREDGHIIARTPYHDDDIDRDISQSTAFLRFLRSDNGQFVAKSASDGVERLYTFGRLPGLPLILSVNRATEDILASWWTRVFLITPVLLVLFVAAVGSSLLFRREIRRRSVAEDKLRLVVEELAALATKDGLTGIPNRRAFDIAYEAEWRRAVRDRNRPVSLLMIDVDYFKPYNDSQGHHGGDQVLRSIASCLQAQVGRAGDLVARYGGEEFVALLPDATDQGAVDMAENMRAAVWRLAIDHPKSPHGRVTVSIGAATCRPLGGEDSQKLIQAADGALYKSKSAGRNQVRTRAFFAS